jgi:hypothetical protein
MSSVKIGVHQVALRRVSGPAGSCGPSPVYAAQPVRLRESSVENIVLLFMDHKEFLKWVPVVGLAISVYSAFFATFVLYPWHVEISRELVKMQSLISSD